MVKVIRAEFDAELPALTIAEPVTLDESRHLKSQTHESAREITGAL